MRLIELLIGLWLSGRGRATRQDDALNAYLRVWAPWRNHSRLAGGWGVAAFVAPPVVAVMMLVVWLDRFWPGQLALGVLIAWLILPADRVGPSLAAFRAAWTAEDLEGVRRAIAVIRPDQAQPAETGGLPRAWLEAMFLRQLADRFVPVFWFAVLGPAGGLLAGLASVLDQHVAASCPMAPGAFRVAVQRLWSLLAWIPVRALVGTLALAGHFGDALEGWRQSTLRGHAGDVERLTDAGLGAGGAGDHDTGSFDAVLAAVHRAFALWLAMVALLTLAGWLG